MCGAAGPQVAYRCGDSTGFAHMHASCFPFNCTCERMCWHQTRAYDITSIDRSRPGVSLTRRARGPKLPRTLVLARAFLRTQLNGKQGAHFLETGPTCAAPATVSEGIAQAVQSRLQCLRARSRTHVTTGREITRLGRGSGAFASPDTGQRKGLAPRGCGVSSTTSLRFPVAAATPFIVPVFRLS